MVAHAQRTILDILASSEVDVKVHNKSNLANVRDRTMYVIASVLDLLAIDGNKIERNFGDSPEVPLDAYLQRFFKYTPCKKDAFIAGLIYLDRAITRCGTVIDSTNIHRLFLASSLTAAKLVEDVTSDCPFNNKMFAIVGGVPLEEMNVLEMEFLESMGYRVHIFPKEFHEYSDAVNSKVDLLHKEYLLNFGLEGEIENNSDESSAHMIYSLIFDSNNNNNNDNGNNEQLDKRESEENNRGGSEEEEKSRESRSDRKEGSNKSNDDFKEMSSSKLQTSQEFSCHMDGGREKEKEKEKEKENEADKEKDKKKKRRRNKKKKNVLYQ